MFKLANSKTGIRTFILNTKGKNSIEIRDLFMLFYSSKPLIFLSVIIFIILGISKSLTSPYEYNSYSKVITNVNSSTIGGFSGISGLSGIGNFGRSGNENEIITPDLYPEIILNDDFLLNIAQETFYFDKLNKELDLVTFFAEYEQRDWLKKAMSIPGYLVSKMKSNSESTYDDDERAGELGSGSSYKRVNARENSAIKKLAGRIEVTETGRIIEIRSKMPDSELATALNLKIIDQLREFVIIVNTNREKENLEFVKNQTQDAQENFERVQMRLATFRDQNMGIVTQKAKSQEQTLQSEFDISFQIYNTLAKEYEQAKLKLQEAKPVLMIFEEPKIPLAPSEPNLILTVIIFSVIGFFLGITFIVFLILRELIRTYTDGE